MGIDETTGDSYVRIVLQSGGAANDLLSVDMGAEDDWSEQYGGDGDDTMAADGVGPATIISINTAVTATII